MTPDQLRAVAAALYGEDFPSSLLADDLKVSDRSVRRWLNGSFEIPAGIRADCLRLLNARANEIGNVMAELEVDLALRETVAGA